MINCQWCKTHILDIYMIFTETMDTAAPIIYIVCRDCVKSSTYIDAFIEKHHRRPRMFVDYYIPPV
jgi:hypothetical protein